MGIEEGWEVGGGGRQYRGINGNGKNTKKKSLTEEWHMLTFLCKADHTSRVKALNIHLMSSNRREALTEMTTCCPYSRSSRGELSQAISLQCGHLMTSRVFFFVLREQIHPC